MIYLSLGGADTYPYMDEALTERHKQVLHLVVDCYASKGQPVSSSYLTEQYNLGLSSATIRIIFGELDQLGYLYSPHRSSGRIPTEQGYRFYVQNLAGDRCLKEEDRKFIQSEYLRQDFRIRDVMEATSRILSVLTDYTGVVLGPLPEASVLKHLELIDMGQDEMLVVLVTRSGTVYSKTVFMDQKIAGESLHKISRDLNGILKGRDLYEVKTILNEAANGDHETLRSVSMITKAIADNFDLVKGQEEFYTYGMNNLYEFVSGSQKARIKELDTVIGSDEAVRGIFKTSATLDDIVVSIDGDTDSRLLGLSAIAASYKMGEKRIGSLGIVGPNRMDYGRVISIIEYLSLLVSNMVTRMSN